MTPSALDSAMAVAEYPYDSVPFVRKNGRPQFFPLMKSLCSSNHEVISSRAKAPSALMNPARLHP